MLSPNLCPPAFGERESVLVEMKPGLACGQSSALKKGLAAHSPPRNSTWATEDESGLLELRPGSRSRWGQSQI